MLVAPDSSRETPCGCWRAAHRLLRKNLSGLARQGSSLSICRVAHLGRLQISYILSADLIAEILPLACQMCDLSISLRERITKNEFFGLLNALGV